jgi:hypothetical protein
MDKRTLQLFIRSWLKPFTIPLLVLMVMGQGITYANPLVFFVSGFAGWRLARNWWQLPIRMLPGFLRIILVLSLVSFLLIIFVKPNGPGPRPSRGLFPLRAGGDSLNKRIQAPRRQLIDYMSANLSKEEASETVWLDSLEALHISEEEIHWQPAVPGNSYSPWKIDTLMGAVRKVQTLIDLNTGQEWRYYQHPLYMVLLFTLGFLIGASFGRRGLLGLILFTPPIYYLYWLIGQGLENAAKKDSFGPWFTYLLPILVGAVACAALYTFLRTSIKPEPEQDQAAH